MIVGGGQPKSTIGPKASHGKKLSLRSFARLKLEAIFHVGTAPLKMASRRLLSMPSPVEYPHTRQGNYQMENGQAKWDQTAILSPPQ